MTDIDKLINHPEKDKIIGKLFSGESPREVAQYLKIKFHGKDEQHLRLSGAFLKEIVDKYFSQYKMLDQIIADEKSGKLNSKLAESLINNKVWQERMHENLDKEIDLKKRIQQMIFAIEARAEQVFDKIQENPGNFKGGGDYILLKYFDLLINALEKADKIINERPDKLIQADITINMVEQHSVVFQEAIREVLLELDPEISAMFMDAVTRKLAKLRETGAVPIERHMDDLEKLLPADFEDLEAEGEQSEL